MRLPTWLRRRSEADVAPMSTPSSNSQTEFGNTRAYHIAAICVIAAYLVTAFVIVDDYGITWDEPADFGIGHKYLYWLSLIHISEPTRPY